MFKRLKNKVKIKLNNYFNKLLDPKLKEIKDLSTYLNKESNNQINKRINELNNGNAKVINDLNSNINKNINDINIKIDNKKDETINDVSRLIKASIVNRETFEPYKDYCKGKKLVICGAGPSLNKYKPIPGAIHIALNRAFLFDKVHFDFIFSNDFKGVEKYQNELIKYDAIKIFGDYSKDLRFQGIYPEYFVRENNAKRFYLDFNSSLLFSNNQNFIKDINLEPLSAVMNVGYIVLQFALFMNPDDIYLVGYDVTSDHFTNNGYSKEELLKEHQFIDKWLGETNKTLLEYYNKFIDFKNYNYPNTKIHSINPIGLKGLFDDIYL